MSDWTQVGENLVKHRGGMIYLRAKVNGKVRRVSLQTSDLRIAKLKRDEKLATLRAEPKTPKAGQVGTLGEALTLVEKRLLAQPHLKAPSLQTYRDLLVILRTTLPLPLTLPAAKWSRDEAAAWWQKIAARYSAQRANNALMLAKLVGKLLVELELQDADPTADLKRVPVGSKHLTIPSRAQVEAIIASVRGQQSHLAEASANQLAFLAFSGCRAGQARAFRWEHVEADWITFPAGVEGSKGAARRRLPISPPLRALLDAMRPPDATGNLFHIARPRAALSAACERLKLPRLRIHDLRHFFASFALESGVEVPVVSRWLGHKDGGVLVLKTYGHMRDEHSLASAEKLR